MRKKNIISQFSEACTGPHTILDGPSTLGWEVPKIAAKGANDIVTWLKQQPSLENNVNLTGFSRGSVTLIRIANNLKKMETDLAKQEKGLATS